MGRESSKAIRYLLPSVLQAFAIIELAALLYIFRTILFGIALLTSPAGLLILLNLMISELLIVILDHIVSLISIFGLAILLIHVISTCFGASIHSMQITKQR